MYDPDIVRGQAILNLIYSCPKQKYTLASKQSTQRQGDSMVCGAPPTFHLDPLSFKYSARQKCIFSSDRDCLPGVSLDHDNIINQILLQIAPFI